MLVVSSASFASLASSFYIFCLSFFFFFFFFFLSSLCVVSFVILYERHIVMHAGAIGRAARWATLSVSRMR